jgi:peptidoglycan/LPS O-acetylase OafA/YrhL
MRIEALTPLRFIAAAVVVNFHFGLQGPNYHGFFNAGPQMVSFFFVLSGFVLAIAYTDRMPGLKAYYLARSARILPVYFLALLSLLVFYLLIDISPNPLGLMLNMVLMQAWYPPLALSMNSPGWSLSIEAFFYLVFPLVLLLTCRSGWRISVLFSIALLFWLATQTVLSSALEASVNQSTAPMTAHWVNYFPLSHLCSFTLGLVGGVWFRRRSPGISNPWLSTAFIVLAAALLVFVLENQRLVYRTVGFKLAFKASFLSPLYLLLIVAIATARGPIVDVLARRPLVFLGEISYSVYILHFPLFIIYHHFVSAYIARGEPAFFISYFILLLAVSACCFQYFEKPANRYFRN